LCFSPPLLRPSAEGQGEGGMKVATKLSGAFGVLVLILAALLVYHVRTIHHLVAANYQLSEISSRLSLNTARQLARLDELEENAGKFWVTRDAGYLQRFEEASRGFAAGLVELDAAALSPEERAEVEVLAERWRAFAPVAARIAAPPAPEAELYRRLGDLRARARRVGDASDATMRARLEASATAARRAERISWAAAAGTLLLSVVVFSLIVRSISGALNRLQRGTHEVAGGNFDYRLPTDLDAEFAALAHDFNGMTQRLGELDRMKRGFLSKVSHDLKTPLASMRETVQVMLDGVPGPITARQRRLLELTDESAVRLSGMIAKILDLSAMEARALALDLRPHDLRPIVESAIAAVASGDAERGSRIQVDSDVALRLECDRDRVVQVLVNLLENAIKFSPADAPIRISTRLVAPDDPGASAEQWRRLDRRSGAVLIEVSDRGCGVPEADRRRIFEHFFQSAGGTRVANRGVGLGLAICREIVDLHGGALWVRDDAGGGSVFAVLLPRPLPAVVPLGPVMTGPAPTSPARA
jgi:signal transduction histidine kinase